MYFSNKILKSSFGKIANQKMKHGMLCKSCEHRGLKNILKNC